MPKVKVIVFPTWKCGAGCPECLGGNTKIRIQPKINDWGYTKSIRYIKPGDNLLTYSEGELVTTTVKAVFKRNVNSILKIKLASGKIISSSGEHPFFLKGGWIKAGDLRVGDELVTPAKLMKAKGGRASLKAQKEKYGFIPFHSGHEGSEKQRNYSRKHMLEANPMKDIEVVKKAFATKKLRPTNTESWFWDNVLKDLPVEYTGGGTFWVGRRNPDFKVIGEKKLIEVSDWGYLNRGDQYIKDNEVHYNKYGFKVKTVLLTGRGLEYIKKLKKEISDFIINGDKIVKITRKWGTYHVYNLECSPYPHFIAEGVLVHNCRYFPQKDGLSIKFGSTGQIYRVEKELSPQEWINLLGLYPTDTFFEFSGGEPLRYQGIEAVLNSLPIWAITSNTLFYSDRIDLSKCYSWTGSYHPHFSPDKLELFRSNMEIIKGKVPNAGITLVATPQNLGSIFQAADRFYQSGFRVNIHPYYDDPTFSWYNYPTELKFLKKSKFVAYNDRLLEFKGISGDKLCSAGRNYFLFGPDGKMFTCLTAMTKGNPDIRKSYLNDFVCKGECLYPCDWVSGCKEI